MLTPLTYPTFSYIFSVICEMIAADWANSLSSVAYFRLNSCIVCCTSSCRASLNY